MTLYFSLLPGLWSALWLVPLASALAWPELRKGVRNHRNPGDTWRADKTPAGVGMNAGVRRPFICGSLTVERAPYKRVMQVQLLPAGPKLRVVGGTDADYPD